MSEHLYKGKPITWVDKKKCPLCNSNIILKAQRPCDGCIKIRYFKCVECDFDTRNLE